MLDSSENDSDMASGEKREKSTSDFEVGSKEAVHEDCIDHDTLRRVFRRAAWYSSAMSAIVIFLLLTCVVFVGSRAERLLVPLPMFFSHYVFSKQFYTFWVACSM